MRCTCAAISDKQNVIDDLAIEGARRRVRVGRQHSSGLRFGTPLASAHDDWYEKQCCHGQHCEPMADDAVRETSLGFKVPSGELLPYADRRYVSRTTRVFIGAMPKK